MVKNLIDTFICVFIASSLFSIMIWPSTIGATVLGAIIATLVIIKDYRDYRRWRKEKK